MARVSTFVFVLLAVGKVAARSAAEDEPVVAIVSGTLYGFESFNGQNQYRINRRHLSAMNNSHVRSMRLDLGPEVAALEMELKQDSAWTDDSVVVVRRGEEVTEIHDVVDSNCFLTGRLTSHNGAATLNRCGHLFGIIHTKNIHYEIEEEESGDLDSEISNVKVTLRRPVEITESKEDLNIPTEAQKSASKRQLNEDHKVSSQDQLKPITAEVAAVLDANFVRYMSNQKNKRTDASLSQFIIMKWNLMRNVYGDASVVGVSFTLQLKKVEIWRTNPPYYARLGPQNSLADFLITFCRDSPDIPNYDHKMLYTQGTGGHHLGKSFPHGICRFQKGCSLVKGVYETAELELHQFGHNIGFDHDIDMQPCTDPDGEGGFMGWYSNSRFLDCYRRRLLQKIRQPEASCLYETNVPRLQVLNP